VLAPCSMVCPFGEGRRPRVTYRGPSRGGKWVYMAPEQFEPRVVDRTSSSRTVDLCPASDVFAATATCVSLLLEGGRPPFLPLAMRTERDGKLRAYDILRHPWRTPAALRRELEVAPWWLQPAAACAVLDVVVVVASVAAVVVVVVVVSVLNRVPLLALRISDAGDPMHIFGCC
jgi:hypothetical protein